MSDSPTSRSFAKILFRVLAVLVLLVLFGMAGAGGAWYYANREHPQPSTATTAAADDATAATDTPANPAAADAKVPPPIFVALDPFTVTLADDVMERVVHTVITLRLGDVESNQRLDRYKPEVRSRVLMVLSAQSPASIAQPATRSRMGQDIAAALKKPFAPLVSEQAIVDVLFTDFVVQ